MMINPPVYPTLQQVADVALQECIDKRIKEKAKRFDDKVAEDAEGQKPE